MIRAGSLGALIALFALGGCATPETRVRTALVDAGLSEPMAGCMAERMVDRLSLAQLNRLRQLGKLKSSDPRTISVQAFVRKTKALQDPEILAVVSAAGLKCALRN